jgi:hypothetical protein
MNRRIFAKSIIGGLGFSFAIGQTAGASKLRSPSKVFEAGHQMKSNDGLKMTLSGHDLPTSSRDQKQFVLTFDVHNASEPLQEKIYNLTDHNGQRHDIYMSPIDRNRLQAVYNWRTHA